MKYFLAENIINAVLPVPAEDIPVKYIPLHEAHIARGIAAGMILFAGPKAAGGGGFFVARAESLEELEAFNAKDPMVTGGISRFKVSEFYMNDRSERMKDF